MLIMDEPAKSNCEKCVNTNTSKSYAFNVMEEKERIKKFLHLLFKECNHGFHTF